MKHVEEQKQPDFIEQANQAAHRVLFLDLGGTTSQDLVGHYLLELVEKGMCLEEIQEAVQSPLMRARLKQIKNNQYRRENAIKRGSARPAANFDKLENICPADSDGPEDTLVEKQLCASLKEMIRSGGLSETEKQILTLDSQGYTSAEIANKLGLQIDTVFSRRADALRKLRNIADRFRDR